MTTLESKKIHDNINDLFIYSVNKLHYTVNITFKKNNKYIEIYKFDLKNHLDEYLPNNNIHPFKLTEFISNSNLVIDPKIKKSSNNTLIFINTLCSHLNINYKDLNEGFYSINNIDIHYTYYKLNNLQKFSNETTYKYHPEFDYYKKLSLEKLEYMYIYNFDNAIFLDRIDINDKIINFTKDIKEDEIAIIFNSSDYPSFKSNKYRPPIIKYIDNIKNDNSINNVLFLSDTLSDMKKSYLRYNNLDIIMHTDYLKFLSFINNDDNYVYIIREMKYDDNPFNIFKSSTSSEPKYIHKYKNSKPTILKFKYLTKNKKKKLNDFSNTKDNIKIYKYKVSEWSSRLLMEPNLTESIIKDNIIDIINNKKYNKDPTILANKILSKINSNCSQKKLFSTFELIDDIDI